MSNTTYAPHELQARVKSLLNEADSEVINSFFGSETPEIGQYSSDEELEFVKAAEDQNITFEFKDNYGGEGQGQGEDYWSVYSFSTNGQTVYVKFDGWYQSYNGSELDEWFFVEPKTVEVIQYEQIKEVKE